MGRFELLAPAGSPEALRAAVNAGADAVYIGGSAFGARAYADNADTDALIECIRFCHLRGRRLYLTVNTLFKEDELENRLFSFLRPYYEAGLDAVIVQDFGAVDFISEHFPGLAIHLSTQTAVTMAEGTQLLTEKYKSITRVVPARELSLKEIERFRKSSDLELEIFIHGALCYCYSGQCLMSSMIGGRSGNRGRCAQPCRKLYDGKYMLSPKDQCLLPVLHELLDTGIDSLKIEGRMKSPEYTAGVVSVYRKYIDRYEELGSDGYRKWIGRASDTLKEDMILLQDLYNRGGFNNGYLKQHSGPDMMTFFRPNHSGTMIGEVIAVRGREAVIRFDEKVRPQDVLEIRAESVFGDKIFEFTVKNGYTPGMTDSCITMKDKKAEVGMKVFRIRNNSLLDSIREGFIEKDCKTPINIEFYGHEGEKARLSFLYRDRNSIDHTEVTVEGNIVEQAKNAPSDEESVRKQLVKLGETDFTAENVQIDIGKNVFIPSGELNRLRREAAELLAKEILEKYGRNFDEIPGEDENICVDAGKNAFEDKAGNGFADTIKKALTDDEALFLGDTVTKSLDILGEQTDQFTNIYSVWNEEGLEAVLDTLGTLGRKEADIYYNISCFDPEEAYRAAERIEGSGSKSACVHSGSEETEPQNANSDKRFRLFFGLPYICRSDIYDKLAEFLISISEKYPNAGFLARTQEEMFLLRRMGLRCRTDYNLYVMNNRAKKHYSNEYTLPLELNFEELKGVADKKSEMIIYGFQPVMFSAQCVYKNKFNSCKNSGHDFITITDELKHDFRCMQDCAFCYNVIYNSALLDLRDKLEDIEKLPIRGLRYDFTFETPAEIGEVIRREQSFASEHSTHGHFLRGVM